MEKEAVCTKWNLNGCLHNRSIMVKEGGKKIVCSETKQLLFVCITVDLLLITAKKYILYENHLIKKTTKQLLDTWV